MSDHNDSEKTVDLDLTIRQMARHCLQATFVPTSTYRLQFNRAFGFSDATKIIPYLSRMGVDAVYCSPYWACAQGSSHGYDVVDPNRINPELGSAVEYEEFCEQLKLNGIKQIVDVVPNHMGIIGGMNKWWTDVLENGHRSRFSKFFDIDWEPEKKELHHKVLLPILGDSFGTVLEDGQISVIYCGRRKGFFFKYWEHELPLAPHTYAILLEPISNQLLKSMSETDKDYLEFLNIVHGLKHVSDVVDSSRSGMFERDAEKDNLKKRLFDLIERREVIEGAIDMRLHDINGRPKTPESFNELYALLEMQAYRLSYWKVASEEINYRRFFDVNELAALRIEHTRVFERFHSLLFHLIDADKVHGIRVDHSDGLYDPTGYFSRIQQVVLMRKVFQELYKKDHNFANKAEKSKQLVGRIDRIIREPEFKNKKAIYLVAEKILDRKEELPSKWPIHGTVGYEHLNAMHGIFVMQKNEKRMTQIYETFVGRSHDFQQLLYEKKKFFALVHMASEINSLGHRLDLISESHRHYRDFTLNNLTLAIREVIACFPVYRTYIEPGEEVVSEEDKKYIHIAIQKARKRTPALSSKIYDFLRSILCMDFGHAVTDRQRTLFRDFILRWQQITGPIMAKGMEDTLFYVYNRLIALNEVGGNPMHFGCSVDEFHKQNKYREKYWPGSMLTGMTHDAKRSEDVRMRLCVLSELPLMWKSQVSRWAIYNKPHKRMLDGVMHPDSNTEYFIYQTLLGIFPSQPIAGDRYGIIKDRVWGIILKSLREAKVYTNWISPNDEYEKSIKRFLNRILEPVKSNKFLKPFEAFQRSIAKCGMLNSISATVLRSGLPGVVDIYQGSEVWDDRFVDPDNRRVVNYHLLEKRLKRSDPAIDQSSWVEEMFRSNHDGRIKQYLLSEMMLLRKKNRDLFLKGQYQPLSAKGRKAKHLIAYMRKWKAKRVVFLASKWFVDIGEKTGGYFVGRDAWDKTWIEAPKEFMGQRMINVLTGEEVIPDRSKRAFALIPVPKMLSKMSAAAFILDIK